MFRHRFDVVKLNVKNPTFARIYHMRRVFFEEMEADMCMFLAVELSITSLAN